METGSIVSELNQEADIRTEGGVLSELARGSLPPPGGAAGLQRLVLLDGSTALKFDFKLTLTFVSRLCGSFQGLKAGSLHFPGTAASYQGEVPLKQEQEPMFHNYKNETIWQQKADKVMGWFSDDGLDFVSLYFGEPDGTGHRYGPDSPQRREMVKQVDRTVGYIRQSADRHGLTDLLNIIITADHGMTTVHRKGAVEEITLSKIPGFSFKDLSFHLVDYGPSGMLLPKPGKLETVYKALKGAHPHLHVYKKEEMPERLHYSNNPRILPIVLYADPGYVINGVG